MSNENEDPAERKARIRRTVDLEQCDCGGAIEYESNHERDSTNDVHRCAACGWWFLEIETWDR